MILKTATWALAAALAFPALAETNAVQTVHEAVGYNSWPMIQAIGKRLVCAYSRGSAHSISEGARGAEWNYLKGCILLQKGWYFDAQRYFEVACYLEPSNAEYQAALQNIRSSAGQQYGKVYQSGSGCSPCSLCAGLICADGLCECCGGDLIRCC